MVAPITNHAMFTGKARRLAMAKRGRRRHRLLVSRRRAVLCVGGILSVLCFTTTPPLSSADTSQSGPDTEIRKQHG